MVSLFKLQCLCVTKSVPYWPIYRLKSLNEHRHTVESIAQEIELVLDEIGVNKFAAIVSDNASNVRFARTIINNQHSKELPNCHASFCDYFSIIIIIWSLACWDILDLTQKGLYRCKESIRYKSKNWPKISRTKLRRILNRFLIIFKMI